MGALGSPPHTAPRYLVDPGVSRFTVRAFAGGMLSALGHNPSFAIREFQGEVTFDPAAPATASLTLTIQAASLALLDHVSERDRREIERVMKEEVLETSKYPTIGYRCLQAMPRPIAEGQFEVSLNGELTLHGVTRPGVIPARLSATGALLRAFGEFSLRQSEFDLKPVTVAGSMLKVKDELKFSFDIVSRRAAEAAGPALEAGGRRVAG